MQSMQNTTVIKLEAVRDARRRLRAADERRERPRRGGRVWLNGGELGGARNAHAHLAESYD
jgi:hypothetical protein